ncbi:MAG: putative transposase [Myxococcota bacterium]
MDLKYNRRVHGETGETPWDRWRAGAARVRPVSERQLKDAFLFRAQRTTDKTGVFRLHGTRFQTRAALARKKVEVRYDPEEMDVVEVWHNDAFQERVSPFQVTRHRRSKTLALPATPPSETSSDYLGHLVEQHQPSPVDDAIARALAEHKAHDDGFVELLRDRVVPSVFDEPAIRDFLRRCGPYDASTLQPCLDLAIELGGSDQHVLTLLRGITDAGEAS